jgi:hypothetical protein
MLTKPPMIDHRTLRDFPPKSQLMGGPAVRLTRQQVMLARNAIDLYQRFLGQIVI